jgi:predicted lysophospholipase L1 biosynthesis ABC-type transport system permease subunit
MARQLWPGEDPLGKSFTLGDTFTVVGIAGSVRSVRFGEAVTVQAYFPIEAGKEPSLSVLVKTAGSTRDLARAAVNAARSLDPNTFPAVELLSSAWRARLEGAEYSAMEVSAMGSVAQILACFGIVGLISYAVSQRTREIGIRMALGAKPTQVLAVVLGHISRPVLTGLVIGIGAAAGLAQFLRGRLYGISHLDPAAYFIAIGVFALTAAVSAVLPARKALRIDPFRALRHD